MKKLSLLVALGALIPSGGLMAWISEPLFLYEADPYFSFSMSTGAASPYKRALNREITVGKHQGASLAVGYKYTSWRFELEAAFRTTEVRDYMRVEQIGGQWAPPGGNFVPRTYEADGSIRDKSLMLNGYYDFRTGRIWRPYVGGGFGASYVALRDFELQDSIWPVRASDSDIVFAYQLMVGVLFELAPETDLTVGYRYFGAESVEWRIGDPQRPDRDETVKFTGSNLHLFEIGLHFNF